MFGVVSCDLVDRINVVTKTIHEVTRNDAKQLESSLRAFVPPHLCAPQMKIEKKLDMEVISLRSLRLGVLAVNGRDLAVNQIKSLSDVGEFLASATETVRASPKLRVGSFRCIYTCRLPTSGPLRASRRCDPYPC